MHVLSATGLSKSYDERVLFRDVSLGVATGDRIGLVGPNGSGKSTLLRILAGTVPPDTGEVVHAAAARISTLAQDPTLPAGTALAAAVRLSDDDAVREHEAAALLSRLGIPPELPVEQMSGGQRRRVALAATLLPPSHLLILDEPTNHLDVWTVDWLEDELRRRTAGLLLVTHDRRMLERLTTRLLEIDPLGVDPTGRGEIDPTGRGAGAPAGQGDPVAAPRAGGGVYWHEGGYSTMLEAREERARRRGRAEARRANLLRKEIAWLRRQPKARTSKPKFRLEQVQALQSATPPGEVGQLQLGTGRRRLGSRVIDAEDVSFRYAPDAADVVAGFSTMIGPGQRLGVVGPNGAGKTTLLRLLSGELEPTSGTIEHGTTVEIGVYHQQAMAPPTDVSVIDTVHAVGTRIPLASGETLPARRLAERFGFSPALQRSAVATLSGGERRRLALLHLLVAAPNVIVLDEPTNDLDLDTLATLEDHLDGFRGTLLVASHDRFVLDRLTDELLAVEPDGTVTRHLDWAAYREAVDAAAALRSSLDDTPSSAGDQQRSTAAADHDRRKDARRRLRRAAAAVERLADLRDDLDAALVAHGTDAERVAELATARARVVEQLAAAEDEWLEVGAEVEQLAPDA